MRCLVRAKIALKAHGSRRVHVVEMAIKHTLRGPTLFVVFAFAIRAFKIVSMIFLVVVEALKPCILFVAARNNAPLRRGGHCNK